jgi:hypothetical protein
VSRGHRGAQGAATGMRNQMMVLGCSGFFGGGHWLTSGCHSLGGEETGRECNGERGREYDVDLAFTCERSLATWRS